MRHLRLLTFFIVLGILPPYLCARAADDLSLKLPAEGEQVSPQQLQNTWSEIGKAIDTGDTSTVHRAVQELEQLKIRAGFISLEGYSIELIDAGEKALAEGDKDGASFYRKMALILSPYSPRILVRSLSLTRATQEPSQVLVQLGQALKWFWRSPQLVLSVGRNLLYPLLWALTIALYAVFIMVIATHIQEILRALARGCPVHIRGFAAPALAFVLFSAPCLMGPICALLVWSLLTLILLPKERWLSFTTGVLLTLWGVLIPIRENVHAWIENPGVQAMLNISTGSFSRADRRVLERLTQERPDDGVVYYTYAQLLRKYGENELAEQKLQEAEALLGNQPWTRAERGIIAFLSGNAKQADALFEEAKDMGLESPELWFNMSKVKFELLDVEGSREYLQLAAQKYPDLAPFMNEREREVGMKGVSAMGEIHLPTYVVLRSALIPMKGIKKTYDAASSALLRGTTPLYLALLGIMVIGASLFLKQQKKKSKFGAYYNTYQPSSALRAIIRLVPGGSWILNGQVFLTLAALTSWTFLALPILNWPAHSDILINVIPDFRAMYISGVLLLGIAISYIAYHCESMDEAEEN